MKAIRETEPRGVIKDLQLISIFMVKNCIFLMFTQWLNFEFIANFVIDQYTDRCFVEIKKRL